MDKKLVSKAADGGVACQYVMCLAVLLGSGMDFEGPVQDSPQGFHLELITLVLPSSTWKMYTFTLRSFHLRLSKV